MKRILLGITCGLVTAAAILCLWLSRSFVGALILAAYIACLWLSRRYDEAEGIPTDRAPSTHLRQ